MSANSLGFVREVRLEKKKVNVELVEIEHCQHQVDWVRRTAKVSIAAQLVFGIISLVGFAKPVDSKDSVLTVLLIFDIVVQFIELVFYLVFVFYKQLDIAFRYIDWFITTPTMLLSLVVFTEYVQSASKMTLLTFLEDYTQEVSIILSLNALTLFLGLLSELNYIRKSIALPLGFIPFLVAFVFIYVTFAYKSLIGLVLTSLVLLIWSLYGITAVFDERAKNISYNCLDIVSKNLYGVFVAIYIWVAV